MSGRGAHLSANATVSAHGAVAITPNDSTVIPVTRAVYVGGAGDIAVRLPDNETPVTFVGVPAGIIFPIQVDKVLTTGTTATNLVAMY
jgi:hypothetical protein